MRLAAMAVLVALGGLTGSLLGNPAAGVEQVSPPPFTVSGESQGLITLASPPLGEVQQFTVVDPATRAMAVYHVDLKTGQIELKSVRNLRFDLQLEDYNGVTPKAKEVRIQVQGP
jgi:hypothetical protein